MTRSLCPQPQRSLDGQIEARRGRLEVEPRRPLHWRESGAGRVDDVTGGTPDCPDVEIVFPLLGLGRRTAMARVPVLIGDVAAADLDEVAARLAATLSSQAGVAE